MELSPLKRDIAVHDKDLLSKLTDRFLTDADQAQRQDDELGDAIWSATKKPLVNLIHASFYLSVLRTYFPSEPETVWRAYVKKKLPLYSRYVDHFLVIGKHFQWDQSTIKVLDDYGYAVPHQQREQHKNVGDQLDEMRKKGLIFRDSSELLKKARYAVWPEVDGNGNGKSEHGQPVVSVVAHVRSMPEVHGSQEIQPETPNGDRVFKGFVSKLKEELKAVPVAKALFRSAASMKPLTEWGKEEMSDMRKALRSSLIYIQEMLDEVLDAQ